MSVFTLVRQFIFPFDKLAILIPKKGKILDVGCGHGHFAKALAVASPAREVWGVDPSREKIKAAKKQGQNVKNLKFSRGFLEDFGEKNFDVAVIVDVLYLLPDRDVVKLLREIVKRLNTRGLVLVKETLKEKNLFYFFILAQELLMIKIFKKTFSQHYGVFLRNQTDYQNLIKQSGLKIKRVQKIKSFLPYPHILFTSFLTSR